MSNTKTQLYIDMLEGARKHTLQVAEGVPEGKRFKQLQEGKATPAWLVGHLANTMNVLVVMFILEGDSVLSKEEGNTFAPDFAGGKTPTENQDEYPAWDEIIAIYNKVFNTAIAGLSKLDDSALGNPLSSKMPDRLREHFSSIEVTLGFMISHDAYHRGQIGLLSKLN
jgi:hypothetical protein